MPENVTGFQPTGNLKKSLIDLAYFDMFPRRSPTFFREEPKFLSRPGEGVKKSLCRVGQFFAMFDFLYRQTPTVAARSRRISVNNS
jgi:hypothetical protein